MIAYFSSLLQATIIYFHSTPEKFVASVIAVLMWFFTYRFLFHRRILGVLPGDGKFRYMNPTQPLQALYVRRNSLIGSKSTEKVPTFMGMPLNPLRNPSADDNTAAKDKFSMSMREKSIISADGLSSTR